MGIQQFETFVESKMNEGMCRLVHLGPLAEHYRYQTGKKPVLVVDGTYFVHHYYSRSDIRHDFLCGGQFKEFIGFMKYFVHKLRELGIEPVFYFDGPTIEAKKDWRKRKNSVKEKRLTKVFNAISGAKCSNSKWNSFQYEQQMLPVLISVCGRFICKYECNCTVFVSVTDCDKELADYANRESCFAILSQDTDFLCLKNATYILSIKHFNLDEMSTLLYDRCAILAYYSFTLQQMRLFASLLGNDVIPRSKLEKFHKKLCGNIYTLEEKCNAVASFVKRVFENCRDEVGVIVLAVVEYLDTLDLNITASELRSSLESYQPSEMENWFLDKDIEEPWLQVLEMAYSRHVECEAVPDVYNTLAGHPYEIGLFLEKPSTNHQAASRVFFTLRQRIYSLLLHEKPWGSTAHEVKEFGQWDNMWHDLESVDVPDLDEGVIHPGLVALWSKDTQRISLQRWALFAKAISPNLDPVVFQRLSYRYVIPVAVLLYLLNLPQNEPQCHPKNQQQAQACEQQVMQESEQQQQQQQQQQPQQRHDEKPNNGEQHWNPEDYQEAINQEPKNRRKNQRKRRRKPREYQQKQGPNEEEQQQKQGLREEYHQQKHQPQEEQHQLKQGPKEELHPQNLESNEEQHQLKQNVPEREQQHENSKKQKLQNHHQPKQVNCYLHDNEIESFIKQAVAVMSLGPDLLKPEILLQNKRPTVRKINLSTLFGYGISMVLFLMSVLGFPLQKNHIMEDVEILRAIINANSRRGSERMQCGNGRREAGANGDSGIEL
ncbi:uncharacterized protein [Anabrus simplex]|uniref:uncharacterized protein isoform X2 n=1 Tax=Anabrus simplex TaxID=316456 RepID=UPI0035A2EA7A